MAVTWVGGREYATQNSVTAHTAQIPASLQDGDVVFFVVYGRSALNTPAGWTKILESSPFGTLSQRAAVFRKDTVVAADSSQNVVFTQASSSRMGSIGAAIRGADPTPNIYNPTNHTVTNFTFPLTLAQSPSNGAIGFVIGSTYNASTSTWTPTLLFGSPGTRFSGSSAELRLAGFYKTLSENEWWPAGSGGEEYLSFATGSSSNSGFTATLIFEAPEAGLVGTAEGFSSTNFGTPVRAGHEASGFSATSFGTAGVGNFFPAKSFETGVPTLEYALTEIDGVAITGSFVTRAPNGTWLVGTRTASDFGAVATSTDAASWAITSVSRNHDAAIRPGDGLCVLPAFGAFRSSTNYSSWATETVTGYETVDMASVCWTGTNFRAIGSNWDCFGSTGDGTWTRIAATGLGGFFSTARIRSGNGVLLLGTVNGLLRRSTNGGTSWASVTSQFGASAINDLYYDATTATWMAVGASGKVSISANDGSTWTARNTGVTTTLYGVSKVGSKWVVVGADGVVLESEDAVAWDVSSGTFGSKIVRAIGASGDEAVLYADGALIGHATTNAAGERVSLLGDFGTPNLEPAFEAEGFRVPVTFGTPQRHIPNIAYVPFGPVEFGRPTLGFVDLIGVAEGFTASFGLPRALEALPDTTQPATPDVSYHDYHRVSGVRLPVFGTPYSASNVQAVAYRFLPVKFGRPSLAYLPRARGFFSTRFGKPSTMTDSVHSTYRIRGVGFGYPRLRIEPAARGFSSTRFGTPIDPASRASGFSSVRFGLPETEPNPHRAFGFSLHGRFGQPRSVRSIEQADGFFATNFGEPRIEVSHVALHIWPQTQFGAPLMKRVV